MSLLVADWTRYVWCNHTCNCVWTRNNNYPTDKRSWVFIYEYKRGHRRSGNSFVPIQQAVRDPYIFFKTQTSTQIFTTVHMILPPIRYAKSRSPVQLSAPNTMRSKTGKNKEDDPMIHRFVNWLPSEVTVQPFGNEASNVPTLRHFIKENRCLWKICNVANFMHPPSIITKKKTIYIYIYQTC